MQGMGLFACRKDAWLGFNPRFVGFASEEGYIHEKYRQQGRRTLCLPFLRWIHRFARPNGVPYTNRYEDRLRNYIIGFRELGWNDEPITRHFREVMGDEAFVHAHKNIEAEIASPFFFFDAIYYLDCTGVERLSDSVTGMLEDWGILRRTIIFRAGESLNSARQGREHIYRNIILHATKHSYVNIFICDLHEPHDVLEKSLQRTLINALTRIVSCKMEDVSFCDSGRTGWRIG
jgi:hypothetical protein